jgi:hypothetical protein|nr:MAG TPA: hypothetical protein [Caudoviricetes sp.]
MKKYLSSDENGIPIVVTYHQSGFVDSELLTDEPELIQTVTKIWISWCCIPAKSKNSNANSYALKHCFERMTGIYLTNNQFKQAMLLCSLYPDCPYSKLNWDYSLSRKSLCFRSHKHTKYRYLISKMIINKIAKEENR